MQVMQNIANAFENLTQKLATNPDDLSRGMATGVIKNMNSANYASSFASSYKTMSRGLNAVPDEKVLDALSNATDFSSVRKIVKGGEFQDDVLSQLFEKQSKDRSAAFVNTMGNAPDGLKSKYYNHAKDKEGFVNKGLFGAEVAKAYFSEDGKKGARIGTAVAGAGVASVGLRYLSGGSMTQNNTGKRDIVGIPFV